MKTLQQAIVDNRNYHKRERIMRAIRLRIFEYEDTGRLEKAQRILRKLKALNGPWYDKRARRLEKAQTDKLMHTYE